MIVNGSAGRKGDVFDRCRKLTLTADQPHESQLLSILFACFIRGGTIEIETDDGQKIVWVQCEHEWEGHKDPNTPNGPGEYHEICRKCGAENPGSFVE